MNKTPIFYGDVVNGKLKLHKQNLFTEYLKGLNGLVSLKLEKKRSIRSLPQNNLYWVWLTILGDEIGYTKDELHDIFGVKYRSEKRYIANKETGEAIEVTYIRSTTTFNKMEMSEYMMKIEKNASELGIILPTPEMFEASKL